MYCTGRIYCTGLSLSTNESRCACLSPCQRLRAKIIGNGARVWRYRECPLANIFLFRCTPVLGGGYRSHKVLMSKVGPYKPLLHSHLQRAVIYWIRILWWLHTRAPPQEGLGKQLSRDTGQLHANSCAKSVVVAPDCWYCLCDCRI